MLDGRIDTQGTVKELWAQGVLDDIAYDSAARPSVEEKTPSHSAANLDGPAKEEDAKKPRKFIKDEHREVGGVKWSIYKTYLSASYVRSTCLFLHSKSTPFVDKVLPDVGFHWLYRRYHPGMSAECYSTSIHDSLLQILGVGEKLWMRVTTTLSS
jgi:hypothetical protein